MNANVASDHPYIVRMKNMWERPGVKVVTEIPKGTRAHEVSHIEHFTAEVRVSVRKGGILFLVYTNKEVIWDHVMTWKEEIRSRTDWVDRVEDWECYGDGAFSFSQKMKILESRMSQAEKRAIDEAPAAPIDPDDIEF